MASTNRSPLVSDTAEANIRGNIDELVRVGKAIGAWDVNVDARQKGATIYITYDNKVDLATSLRFCDLLQQSPGMLGNALRLLIGEEQVVG